MFILITLYLILFYTVLLRAFNCVLDMLDLGLSKTKIDADDIDSECFIWIQLSNSPRQQSEFILFGESNEILCHAKTTAAHCFDLDDYNYLFILSQNIDLTVWKFDIAIDDFVALSLEVFRRFLFTLIPRNFIARLVEHIAYFLA